MNFLQSVFLTFVVASATRPKGSEQTTPAPTIPESTTPYGYAKLRKEIKLGTDDMDCLGNEVGLLKSTLSEKDTIIDGLVLRLSNLDRAKKREQDVLARLRSSVESAERKLNASRIHD